MPLIFNQSEISQITDNVTLGYLLDVQDKGANLMQVAGGGADVQDRIGVLKYEPMIVGGSIAWNQLVEHGNFDAVTGWEPTRGTVAVSDNVLSYTSTAIGGGATQNRVLRDVTYIDGHKYLIGLSVKPAHTTLLHVRLKNSSVSIINNAQIAGGEWSTFNVISPANSSDDAIVIGIAETVDNGYQIGDIDYIKNVTIYDLTQMFGDTIADFLYALETNRAGDGVAWFRNMFPKDYYAYNAGELMSVNASSLATVGFNAFDVSTGKAMLLGGREYQVTGSYTTLTFGGSSVTPDADGKFTPSENGELTVTGGDATTCVHLVWNGARDGESAPYGKNSYSLDSTLTLRGIPKVDASGKLYYDGDTYAPDGTVTRYYEQRAYEAGDESLLDAITDGTNTVVKLALPTTESADPYTSPQYVDSYGTMFFVDAGARDVEIPVGHEEHYLSNLKDIKEVIFDDVSVWKKQTAYQQTVIGNVAFYKNTNYPFYNSEQHYYIGPTNNYNLGAIVYFDLTNISADDIDLAHNAVIHLNFYDANYLTDVRKILPTARLIPVYDANTQNSTSYNTFKFAQSEPHGGTVTGQGIDIVIPASTLVSYLSDRVTPTASGKLLLTFGFLAQYTYPDLCDTDAPPTLTFYHNA